MKKDLTLKEESALALSDTIKSVIGYAPEHVKMIQKIDAALPEIKRATSLFCKDASQFMDNMLNLSNLTPLRNMRQCLAEIERCRSALRENFYSLRKKEIELKIKERDFNKEEDELKRELLNLEIEKLYSDLEEAKGYVSGAIRRVSNYVEQYNSIAESTGNKDFTEADFERDEERYHIMKAFDQALTAARSRAGSVDEGNQIYFMQIGVSGASAQKDIIEHILSENNIMQNGQTPDHSLILDFLKRMADKYQGSAIKLAQTRGMKSILTEDSLLERGDTRLLNQNTGHNDNQ